MNQPANSVVRAVWEDPVVQLAAICPLCALAALSPTAALAAISPVLRVFNPAVNPSAALLAFVLSNPQQMITSRAVARTTTRLAELGLKHRFRTIYR